MEYAVIKTKFKNIKLRYEETSDVTDKLLKLEGAL